MSLDELEELVEYAIASYHGTPHAGLNNVTPLEAMEHFIRGKQSAKRCSVRAPRHGIRPHINLHGVRYTSDVLARSTQLIGKPLLAVVPECEVRGGNAAGRRGRSSQQDPPRQFAVVTQIVEDPTFLCSTARRQSNARTGTEQP
ncbi:hypothetical protein [Cupriavidus sp. amp6]|uniref:hypothetical protein n=1 Tax=Cupriavidus sp. amp6 TaxID=388051 RepID=UPI00350F6D0F